MDCIGNAKFVLETKYEAEVAILTFDFDTLNYKKLEDYLKKYEDIGILGSYSFNNIFSLFFMLVFRVTP